VRAHPTAVTAWRHELAHDGEFFRVRGPLDVPRSSHAHPVLVQAGSSDDGKAFAARLG
jgi:alkanesulfonate monooxygenase SsuD/methylene tetrahydromethanopterin reductase-like flavin-dependent oxidoreductase (luciferase family)